MWKLSIYVFYSDSFVEILVRGKNREVTKDVSHVYGSRGIRGRGSDRPTKVACIGSPSGVSPFPEGYSRSEENRPQTVAFASSGL